MTETNENQVKRSYEAPVLTEVGSFETLTQANFNGTKTDVPFNTPGGPGSPVFS